jgi:hypothetical protein
VRTDTNGVVISHADLVLGTGESLTNIAERLAIVEPIAQGALQAGEAIATTNGTARLPELDTLTLSGWGEAGVDGAYARASDVADRPSYTNGTFLVFYGAGLWNVFGSDVAYYSEDDTEFPDEATGWLAGSGTEPTGTMTYAAKDVQMASLLRLAEDALQAEADTLDTVADRGATTDQALTTGGLTTTGGGTLTMKDSGGSTKASLSGATGAAQVETLTVGTSGFKRSFILRSDATTVIPSLLITRTIVASSGTLYLVYSNSVTGTIAAGQAIRLAAGTYPTTNRVASVGTVTTNDVPVAGAVVGDKYLTTATSAGDGSDATARTAYIGVPLIKVTRGAASDTAHVDLIIAGLSGSTVRGFTKRYTYVKALASKLTAGTAADAANVYVYLRLVDYSGSTYLCLFNDNPDASNDVRHFGVEVISLAFGTTTIEEVTTIPE